LAHNYRHHVFTNVLEMDDHLGFGVLRLSRDQPWAPAHGRERGCECCAQSVGILVIFCGHFPDGAEKFTRPRSRRKAKSDWYLRQMLGTANGNAGPLLAFAGGNLRYQIEHHLFPDLPSNHYPQIATRVRARRRSSTCLCLHHRLATGPVHEMVCTIHKLALRAAF
jgi:fatty acid desaturase